MKQVYYILLGTLSFALHCSEQSDFKKRGAVVVVGRIMSGKSTLLEYIKREMSTCLPMPYVLSTDQYIKDCAQIKRADHLKNLIKNAKEDMNQQMNSERRALLNTKLLSLEKELQDLREQKNLEQSLRSAHAVANLRNWQEEDRPDSFWIPYNNRIEDAINQESKWVIADVCCNAEPVRNDLIERLFPSLDDIVLVQLDADKKVALKRLKKKSMQLFSEINKIYLKEQSQDCIRIVQDTLARYVSSQKSDLEKQYDNPSFFSLSRWESTHGTWMSHGYDLSFNTSAYTLDSLDNETKVDEGYKQAAAQIVALLRKKTGRL